MDSVGIVIISKKTNKFLFLHRVESPVVWSILTGTMDIKGETPIQTVKREIEEEINVKSSFIKNIQKIGSLTNKNKGLFHVFVGFVDEEFTPNLELKENDRFKWCDEKTLPKPIHDKWGETYNLVKNYLNLKEVILNKVEKLIKEEIENIDDFDWIKGTPDFEPGKYFEDDDMCYNTNGSECKVNINDDKIIFFLDYEEWRDKISEGFGDNHIVEPLLNDPNYDGNGDYYDFDDEEFNYSGYHMSNEQRERLQKILNLFDPNLNLEEFINDSMNDLKQHLTNKEIQSYFDTLKYKYLDIIGYQVQENRWKSIAEYYKDTTLRGQNQYNIPVQFKLIGSRWGGEDIQITVSTEDLVNLMYEKNENNLSRALDMVSSIVTRPNWFDYFYEDWDTSGSEDQIKEVFDKFLTDSEEYIENESEEFKEQINFYETLKKLGFETRGGQSDVWTKETPDGGMWMVSRIDFQNGKLRLDKKDTTNRWSPTDEKNIFVIEFEDLPVYLSQYRMDI